MIVISSVLLLLAIVFVLIGLFGSLAWIYAAIVAAVAALVTLCIVIRGHRERAPTPAALGLGGDPRLDGTELSTDQPGGPPDVLIVPASGAGTSADRGESVAPAEPIVVKSMNWWTFWPKPETMPV